MTNFDPIQLEIFKHKFSSIAEEMGAVLQKSSYSPNIKERRDFSCALFDPHGEMVALAEHIPVHLGSMPSSVKAAIGKFTVFHPGDVIILNDPYYGGTHLPDITLVSPIFDRSEIPELIAFVASRAHHADVGGIVPGSMPVATELYQEGLIIPPVKLFGRGELNSPVMDLILGNVRTPKEREGDLWAQISANLIGVTRVQELLDTYTPEQVDRAMQNLISYTELRTRKLIASLPAGKYTFQDYLDNDGIDDEKIKIQVEVALQNDTIIFDFSGTDNQVAASVNAVESITLSAVYYVLRLLLDDDIPNNAGCLKPVRLIAPSGSVINARKPAAVAGGNVETSQRIVDVLLGALSKAIPERIPAASQGTMNNITIGGWDPIKESPFTYYETICGGAGASKNINGTSAVHTHMTNTLNTPVEAIEYEYPLRIAAYQIRENSGGKGRFIGGDGVIRRYQLLSPATVTFLTERRTFQPYGLLGGYPGKSGENLCVHQGETTELPSKGTFEFTSGDEIEVRTPGGGGYGVINSDDPK